MVRGNIFSKSPEFILCEQGPLIRLTAPRLQLLQHSSTRFSIPVVGFRAGVWFRLSLAKFLCRFASRAVHTGRSSDFKRVVVLIIFRATSQTAGVISRWRKVCTGHGKVRLWLAENDEGCHSYRWGMHGLHPNTSRFLFPTGCYRNTRIRRFWSIHEIFIFRFVEWH